MKQNRIKALSWWGNLPKENKILYWRRYISEVFSPSTNQDELTGREIELIYIKEMEKAYYPEGLE